ncbi:MAG: hypothetical protein ACO3ZF_04390 [Ilumatobacteraceae bacterium]
MLKTRRTWILWFTLLAVPGSGFLRFDGLPFSSKAEVSVLATSVLVLSSSGFRAKIKSLLSTQNKSFSLWINTALTFLILLKFLSFVIAPLGDGFEACYRSIYNPPADSVLCEPSFETPFINKDNVNGQNQITRMEDEINFGPTGSWVNGGASHTTWKLPFANDFPRFSVLWLDRLPFTAKFGSYLNIKRDAFVPIQFVGEAKATISDKSLAAASYKQPSILLVPVSPGRSKFNLDFKFADLESSAIPDAQPPIAGPWAQLFVGKPLSMDWALKNCSLNLRGWSIDKISKTAPEKYEVRKSNGEVIADSPSVQREDVSALFNDKNLEFSGFDFSIKKLGVTKANEQFDLVAIYAGGAEIQVAKLGHNQKDLTDISTVQINQTSEASFDAAWFSLDTDSVQPLNAVPQVSPNSVFKFSLALFDLLIIALTGLSMLVAIGFAITKSRNRVVNFLTFAISLFVISKIIEYSSFGWWGYRHAAIPLAVAIALAIVHWRAKSIDMYVVLIGALIAITSPMINFIREFNGLESADWWGFQIFRGRDSDWLAYQGYAKTIFNTASLQGGEAVFWFQPANRYFIFLQHLIFGENDVFLAVLFGIAIIFVGALLARNATKLVSSNTATINFVAFVTAILLLMSEQIFQTFASAPASELVAAILIMSCFAAFLSSHFSVGTAYAVTVLAALTSQFRAEQVFGAALIFVLLQLVLKSKLGQVSLVLRTRLTIVFGLITSLSLIHNLYYGDSFTFFTGTNQRGNYEISLSELLNFFSDPRVREVIFTKLRMIFTFNFPLEPLEIGFLIFHLMWLSALVRTIKTRSRDRLTWLAMVFPFLYLIPLLPYEIVTYFPRRIIAIQLAFGVSALFVLSRLRSNLVGRVDDLQSEVGHVGANSVDLPLN